MGVTIKDNICLDERETVLIMIQMILNIMSLIGTQYVLVKSSIVHGNLLIYGIGSTSTFSSVYSTNNNK